MAAATAFRRKSKRAKGIFARRSTVRINYVAIVVAAILYFLLGGLWFGFLFSKQWVALEGFKAADLKNINPTVPYIVSMIANLVIAFILALVCATQKANSAVRGRMKIEPVRRCEAKMLVTPTGIVAIFRRGKSIAV